MEAVEHDLLSDEAHPIDIVETLAERRSWEFDRVGEDQIAMAVEGLWRTYSVSLAWAGHDQTLRLVVSFEMQPPEDRLADLALAIQQANDECWTGGFSLWRDDGLMVYRYGLTLAGGATATAGQIDAMLRAAVEACERFYPAFQLVAWGGEAPDRAIGVAIAEAWGRA
jgi:hypothetical protein